MLGPSTILFLLVNSQKHEVNPAEMATRAHASIATTKGSAFHMSSPKLEWIIDSVATDHTAFDPSQLICCKPSTQSTSSRGRRLIALPLAMPTCELWSFVPRLDSSSLAAGQHLEFCWLAKQSPSWIVSPVH
ncbi:unnamed protein product [Prunus armeniaca]